ncbi:MAG: YjjG family noncanonical pyrimidine nucleotidase [Cellulosilyticaceae bacterium]
MKKYDVILLDIDGTLMDFEKAQDAAFEGMLTKHQIIYSDEIYDVYKKINKGLWEALERGETTKAQLKSLRFERFLEAIGMQRDVAEVVKDYETLLGQGVYFIEGAEAICEQLKAHCTVAVVTNGISTIQNNRLEKSGLKPYFDYIFISEEVGFEKPHKGFFEKVFEVVGITDRSRVLIVGDSLSADIKGGNNAGIDTCWFNPEGQLAKEGLTVTYNVKSLGQLSEIVGI